MNRKKKINQILIARHKKKIAKLKNSNKPRYISKADRAKAEAAQPANDDAVDMQSAAIIHAETETGH